MTTGPKAPIEQSNASGRMVPHDGRRIERSEDDLRRQLNEHVRMLIHHCAAYDKGEVGVAKSIAGVLYQFFHQGKNQGANQALLGSLGLLTRDCFLSFSRPLEDRTIAIARLTYLVQFGYLDDGQWKMLAGHTPYFCNELGKSLECKSLSAADWWGELVILFPDENNQRREFSRSRLVRSMADSDGGRHTDTRLDRGYHDLTRSKALGYYLKMGDQQIHAGGVEQATMRQLAHETLMSLMTIEPSSFDGKDYVFPTMGLVPDFEKGGDAIASDSPPPTQSALAWLRYYGFIPST